MTLLDHFSPAAARGLPGPDWLADRRAAAVERLAGLEWPTAAEEIWRYSRIGDLDLGGYRPVPAEQMGEPGDEPAPGGGPIAAEAGERSGLVVVRNGRVVHHALDPDLEARGVRVCGIATCDAEEIASTLGVCSDASPDAFTVLHDAFLAGGAFVKVPRGVVIEQPIVVLHWSEGDGLASFPHTLVVAEDGAEVTVFDRYGSTDTGVGTTGHLVDAVVELVIGENAHVRYLSVQEHGPRTWQVALQRAHLGRDSSLRSSVVALGGAYARLRSESLLAGSGAESDLTAVYFGDGDQMLDFRTLQDHDAPNTRSDLLFKGAVEDTAQSVYSGLIRIRPRAQKSVAFQTNRNLVLTEGAEAKSVPNLEIEADDVKCSHASTVGPVDDDQLYYLATRGVPPEEAERLVVLGFFDDVFDRLPVPSLVTPLRRSVIEKIEHRDPIARARG
ncbi:MAG TPA: Fe-S cluster assembly protein SufD [Acidimicrobiia bacterium]|nr:Fe-S cluster assembly protein SufD [Acidimicrobiia bacterium]